MRFSRIVVGVDFGEVSLATARWVATAFAPEAELILVHVLPGAGVPPFVRSILPNQDEIATAAGPPIHAALRGVADLVEGARARVMLASGTPPAALARVARDVDADLVCVGRGRRRRGGARFGATTAHRLLVRSQLPTLIAPARLPGTIRRMLVGADSRSAGELAGVGLRLATRLRATVDVLHVIEPEVEHVVGAVREGADPRHGVSGTVVLRALSEPRDGGHGDWLSARGHEWLADVVCRANSESERNNVVIRRGDAGSQIIRHAREASADLVLVGLSSDRRGGQPAPGSTTRLVTWAAPCPVLVVPPVSSARQPTGALQCVGAGKEDVG